MSGARPGRIVDELCASCAQETERQHGTPSHGLDPKMPDVAMVRGTLPISEFDEADLLSGANAPLFANGRGLHRDKRREQGGRVGDVLRI